MNGKQKGILIIVGFLLLLLVGAAGYTAFALPGISRTSEASHAPVAEAFTLQEEPRLRVHCDALQWYDGARWQTVEDFEALCGEDPLLVESVSGGTPGADVEADGALYHNRALGDVPRTGGGGGGGGGGGAEWSGDYE